MKKVVGYSLFGIVMAVIWVGHAAIWVSYLVAVVVGFIEGGVLIGLMIIVLGGIGAVVLWMIWTTLTTPISVLAGFGMALAGGRKDRPPRPRPPLPVYDEPAEQRARRYLDGGE